MAARKKPPIRYRRGKPPPGIVKLEISTNRKREVKPGTLLEFNYGGGTRPQVQGEVGKWKHDPKPILLVFYDDGVKYIEGVNTNYLSSAYLQKLKIILRRFPGLDGNDLYKLFKRTAQFAIKKGYRKYIRTSLLNPYIYVYEDDVAAMLNINLMIKKKDEVEE